MQTFRAVQWNIGAAKIRSQDADPVLPSSYAIDDLSYIIEALRAFHADIITVQEAHMDDSHDQIAQIAEALNYQYVSDSFSESHMDSTQRLGQGIISRFPLRDHASQLFWNPKFQAQFRGGPLVTTFDKGLTIATTTIGDTEIEIKTLHAVPFNPFKVSADSPEAAPVFADMDQKAQSDAPYMLLQGDFNPGQGDPTLKQLMPRLLSGTTHEVETGSTIPFGERSDRVVYRGLKLLDCTVRNDFLTDHYPIVTTFDISV